MSSVTKRKHRSFSFHSDCEEKKGGAEKYLFLKCFKKKGGKDHQGQICNTTAFLKCFRNANRLE